MKIKITTIIAVCLIAFATTNCQKPKDGAVGPQGTNGKDGNANVSSVTLNANSWTWDGTNYWSTASFANISILTSNVVNGGAVMMYENFGSGVYMALPQTINLTSSVQQHSFFSYANNTVVVYTENSDLSNPNPSATSYKLVCIPPAIIKSNPNIDLTNYSEVKHVLDLKD